MKGGIKKRWGVVAVIWVSCILLSGWNVKKIHALRMQREKTALLERRERFLKRNHREISRILKRKDALYQPVDSLKMGVVAIEDTLTRLAGNNGLGEVTIKYAEDPSDGTPLRIQFSCAGPLKGMVKFLNLLDSGAYPFLTVSEMNLRLDESGLRGTFAIVLHYRYRLSASNKGDPSKGVSG